MDKSKIPLSLTKTPGLTVAATSKILVPKSINIPRDDLNIHRPIKRGLKRRSNSCTDLRSIGTTPLTRPKIQPLTNFKTGLKFASSKPNLKVIPEKVGPKQPKLASATATSSSSNVQRPAKIPPYDYKARYNQQVERFKALNERFQEKQTELSNLQSTKEQHQLLLQDFTKLQTDCQNLNQIYTSCKNELADALQKNFELEETLSFVRENYNSINVEHQALLSLHNTLKKKVEDIQKENNRLQEHQEQLNGKLSEALQANELQEEVLLGYQASIQEHENTRRVLHNQIQDLKGNVRVFCRVRPSLLTENDKLMCNFTFFDENTLEIKRSREITNFHNGKCAESGLEFIFDKVFHPETSQMEVFKELSQLIQSAIDGYHVCVFAYGQTGSGKTYTMQGQDHSISAGMIPRTINLIFQLIAKYQEIGWNYVVHASFLEIYNETIRDLLNPQSREHLEIRYNEGKGTTVTNLTTKLVQSAEELRHLMLIANQNRAVAVTNFNEHSSRSHAVTKITLTGTHNEIKTVYIGSLSLVDLAGSESAKTSSSERIMETKNINKSLSALGSVMTALQNKENHIPYRNSKLTYLLQSSLGGNSKTLMFVNVAPFEECYNESVNALRFASKVKEIKLISKRNKTIKL